MNLVIPISVMEIPVYSYGAYDETEHKFFGMFSQGTIVKAAQRTVYTPLFIV